MKRPTYLIHSVFSFVGELCVARLKRTKEGSPPARTFVFGRLAAAFNSVGPFAACRFRKARGGVQQRGSFRSLPTLSMPAAAVVLCDVPRCPGSTAARSKTTMRAKMKMSCSRPRRWPANERLATAVLVPRPLLRTRCCSRAGSGRARLRASRLRTRRRLGGGGLRAAGMTSARRRRRSTTTWMGVLAVGCGRRGQGSSRCAGRRLRGGWATCVRDAETVPGMSRGGGGGRACPRTSSGACSRTGSSGSTSCTSSSSSTPRSICAQLASTAAATPTPPATRTRTTVAPGRGRRHWQTG